MADALEILVRFPVPGYGLRCPVCRHGLDGLPTPTCPECGERFELRELIEAAVEHDHRARGAAIRILAENASQGCPIGADLVRFFATSDQHAVHQAAEMVVRVARQRQEAVRDKDDVSGELDPADLEARAAASPPGVPFFTGEELPFPDFGLHCRRCRYPLRGLPRHVCPECGEEFAPAGLLGTEPTLQLCAVSNEVEYFHVKSALDARGVPHLLETTDVLADTLKMRVGKEQKFGRVTVPREFYFDALFWLQRASGGCGSCGHGPVESEDTETEEAGEWTCPACNETVPGGFDMCWSCCAERPANP